MFCLGISEYKPKKSNKNYCCDDECLYSDKTK